MSKKDDTIKVSSESKLQLPLANLIGIILVVSGAVFGYANLTGRISALETADKQDARQKFSKDWTTRVMGIAVLGGFLGYIFLVTLQPPEQNSEALINLVLGYLGGLASAVVSFYFGASNGGGKQDK